MSQLSILKALSDESRLRILSLLSDGPLCVCEIEALLNLLQSNVSRHLNKLNASRVVRYYKNNKYIYYEIDKEWLEENAPFVFQVLEHEKTHNPLIEADLNRLMGYKMGKTSDLEMDLKKICWCQTGKEVVGIENGEVVKK